MSITCGKCGTQLFSGTVNSSVRCVQCDINDLAARANEYGRKLREERAENARLRRQVERLVPLEKSDLEDLICACENESVSGVSLLVHMKPEQRENLERYAANLQRLAVVFQKHLDAILAGEGE